MKYLDLGRYKHKITEEEFKSATNVCKKLAREFYEKNCRYTYEEYLSECYYGLVRSIKYFDRDKASFPTLTRISATNGVNMLLSTDKRYNYRKGLRIEKYKLPVSMNAPIKDEVNKNKEINTYEEIIASHQLHDYTYELAKDYIVRVFNEFYAGFKTNNPKFNANKDRDIGVLVKLIEGYTPMEVSKMYNISNQVVNSIIKKFRKYAIENDLRYCIN